MTEHTPGPWTIKQFGGPQISGPKGYAVATMWGALSVRELKGQDLANAKLIAAAPELLEACVEFVRRVEAGEIRSKLTYATMKAVIAKAKGEQS